MTGLFSKYPYQNYSDYNLDWLIEKIKETMNTQEKQQAYMETLKAWMDENEPRIEHIENMYELFTSGELPPEIVDALETWLNDYGVLDAARTYTDEQTAIVQNNLNTETTERTAADLLLQSQIDQIISPSGEAPSAAEVENARIGADGNHYTTLGQAIRTQVSELSDEIDAIADVTSRNLTDLTTWQDGTYVNISNGSMGNNANYTTSAFIELQPNTEYIIVRGDVSDNLLFALFTEKSSNGFTRGVNLNTGTTRTITTSSTEKYIRISPTLAGKTTSGVYHRYFTKPTLKANVVIPTLLEKLEINPTAANPTNYTTVLPDANRVIANTAYKMYFSLRSTDIPANLPFTRWITDQSVMLITFGTTLGSNAGVQQICIGRNFCFIRQYTSAWQPWNALFLEVNVGSGYGVVQHFTSLTEAIVFATQYRNAIVNVYSGTFDLYQEFIDYYGEDFFTNYTATTTPRGLYLTNNVHVRCSSNAKIVFRYAGDNVNVLQQFSPFNFLSNCVDGFTLENARVECSRCRYVVHDDPSDTSRAYHNHYINCKFKMDNHANEAWNHESVIGGGLGRAGAVTIDGCLFESTEYMTGSDDTVHRFLSYHNDISTNLAVNSVEIRNCYLTGRGKIVIYYGGTSPVDSSRVLITNNSMGAPIEEHPTRSEDTIHNMDVIAWNNEIRA